MTIVTTSEAQALLSQLIISVGLGEEVVITEGGLPVAQLIKPITAIPTRADSEVMPETVETDDDDERPWRGVLSIESPGDPYPSGQLKFSAEHKTVINEPVDILWDRVNQSDE